MSSIRLRDQESGLVAIVVAITFITIMSLIATSFALLSRNEQRQALDRQLSTQAFYAAESGINDAIEAIRDESVSIDDCSDTASLNPTGTSSLGNGLSYTCVLVNEQPTNLEFGPVTADDPTTVKVQAAPGSGPIRTLRISWQDFDGGNIFATNDTFLLPQASHNAQDLNSFANHTGILRTNVIPVTSTISRQELIDNTQTLFLYPKAGNAGTAGSIGYQTGQSTQGSFVSGNCNRNNTSAQFPRFCSVDVTSLPDANSFYVRLNGIYQSSGVTIQAFGAGGSNDPLTLVGGQVIIDATGKANDVLRRIQVRVPVETKFNTPRGALQTMDSICKLISQSTTTTFEECQYDRISEEE